MARNTSTFRDYRTARFDPISSSGFCEHLGRLTCNNIYWGAGGGGGGGVRHGDGISYTCK